MQSIEQTLTWLSQFPALQTLEPESLEMLAKHSRIVEAPVGTIGYSEGMPCPWLCIALKGALSRV